MININNIKTSFEGEALWVNISVYSSENQEKVSHIIVSLYGEEEKTIALDEKLLIGDNDIELMFTMSPNPWFPNGIGDTNVYELSAQIFYEEDVCEYSSFLQFSDISYENKKLYIYDYNVQYFGLSLNIVGLPQIEIAQSKGINAIFTSDRRKEVVDYCNIKGIVLLPYEAPTCSIEQIEEFRHKNKPIILKFDDIKNVENLLDPIYIGKNFISNNTNKYISPTLTQGTLNPLTNEINITKVEEINIEEFSNYEYDNNIIPNEGYIAFTNLWLNKNIIAKRIIKGSNVKYKKSNVLVSRFQTQERTWEVLFSSNEFINNIEIITENEINKNNFSIFPGETVQVTFSNITNEPEFEIKTL